MPRKPTVPPLALVAAAAGAQRLMAKPARKPSPKRLAVSTALGAASLAFAAASVREFRKSQTTVNPMSPEQATSLVVSGPFLVSRNPMYVGMAGLLSAHAVARGNWAAALPVIGFVGVIHRVQIPAEEAALTDHFGPTYIAYAARVPRWLGRPDAPARGLGGGS